MKQVKFTILWNIFVLLELSRRLPCIKNVGPVKMCEIPRKKGFYAEIISPCNRYAQNSCVKYK